MTDDDLDGDDVHDAALATELRRTLVAVADATPMTDRRAELIADLDRASRRSRGQGGGRRILAVAAVLLLVGAVAVALALRADQPIERTDLLPELPAPDTGWYLPPAGWTITEVQSDYLNVGDYGATCPCRAFAAAEPGSGSPAVLDLAETGIPDRDDLADLDTEAIDVGGRDGVRVATGELGETVVIWVDLAGRRITVGSRGVPDDVMVALIDVWADAVEADQMISAAALPLPTGYVRTGIETKDRTFEHLVAVTAEHDDTGERVEYQLVPTGQQRYLLFSSDTITAGADGSLHALGDAGEGLSAIAIGGPVDITAGVGFFGSGPSDLDRDELVAFRDGLREVDVDAWRTALRDVPDVPSEVLAAATLSSSPLAG